MNVPLVIDLMKCNSKNSETNNSKQQVIQWWPPGPGTVEKWRQ